MKLWKTFTDCFNCLPIAAIVDEKILCMHGGLFLLASFYAVLYLHIYMLNHSNFNTLPCNFRLFVSYQLCKHKIEQLLFPFFLIVATPNLYGSSFRVQFQCALV